MLFLCKLFVMPESMFLTSVHFMRHDLQFFSIVNFFPEITNMVQKAD